MNPALVGGIVGAITAGVVTLVVEYAAKPRLEARKERVVAAHRSSRSLVVILDQLREKLSAACRYSDSTTPSQEERASLAVLTRAATDELLASRDALLPRVYEQAYVTVLHIADECARADESLQSLRLMPDDVDSAVFDPLRNAEEAVRFAMTLVQLRHREIWRREAATYWKRVRAKI